jgi:hypothetical protein
MLCFIGFSARCGMLRNVILTPRKEKNRKYTWLGPDGNMPQHSATHENCLFFRLFACGMSSGMVAASHTGRTNIPLLCTTLPVAFDRSRGPDRKASRLLNVQVGGQLKNESNNLPGEIPRRLIHRAGKAGLDERRTFALSKRPRLSRGEYTAICRSASGREKMVRGVVRSGRQGSVSRKRARGRVAFRIAWQVDPPRKRARNAIRMSLRVLFHSGEGLAGIF